MKKMLVILCGIAVLSGISGTAFAGEMKDGPRFSPEMKAKMEQRRDEMQKKLGLTQDQKEKMKAMHQDSREKIKPLFESFKAEKDKMKELKESNASEQAIAAQREKLHQVKKEMETVRKSSFEQFQAVLTPAQQQELKKMRDERKKDKRHDGRRGEKFRD